MPAMPRSKKAIKIIEKIIGKPENLQDGRKVYRVGSKNIDGINRNLDSWYNHKI